MFDFPALVIGSLCPDAGYGFGSLELDRFSHRLLAGSFGFCLPIGLLSVFLFRALRRPVVQRLPANYRRIFEPFCRRPAGRPLAIVVSLLIGAWTHILLDAVTHKDGFLVVHFPVLQQRLILGDYHVFADDLLYAIITFCGALFVALAYLNFLERAAGAPAWAFPGFKWIVTLMFAILSLWLGIANHTSSSLLLVGVLTAALVIAFLGVAGLASPLATHSESSRLSAEIRTHAKGI